ncbi:MAG: hydantoinase B/oxoprolinase family protein [Deltaproteobacteria bacterium]|nr:hydantoinase B/oxoprolinase family protein [Deltaproteobacteria bacterium]
MNYIVGVDIGGTFTDCVVLDEAGNQTIAKALSTPDDFSVGVIDAVREAARILGLRSENELVQSTLIFFHACTVGDNTIITRAGAKTGLVTTRGFGDIILMMRGKTWDGLSETEAAHLSALCKPEPIVPKSLIEEITERVDHQGTVLIRLSTDEIREAIERLLAKRVESVAVSLLWSIANASHEKLVGDRIKEDHPSLFVSLSSEVAPYLGEYERTATTVINAYIGPKISVYLRNLKGLLENKGLRAEPLVMQAYGGVLGIDASCKNAVGSIESGPAAGVVGSQFLGQLLGEPNILATDMGGTTFKVSLVTDGMIEKDYKPVIARHNILSTKIWIESIGAGGGSIAWIDPEGRLLKVGPQGAGAKPGPVCYGRGGTEPTVSDAALILGYLNEAYFLGGKIRLDKSRAVEILKEKIARPLGLNEVEAARGIYLIANSHMSDLIRKATVEKGRDPRKYVLFAYGGAGPVHASRYAAELGILRVIIPLTASVHGASGLVTSDVVYQYGKSDHLLVPADVRKVNENFSGLIGKALSDLTAAGFRNEEITISRSVDMRYRHQVHEVNVSLDPGGAELTEQNLEELYERFDTAYEMLYGKGSAYREAGKEIMNFRLAAAGRLKKPAICRQRSTGAAARDALKTNRPVYFEEYRDFVQTAIYDFGRLTPGAEIAGPAVIETPVTTIVINPPDCATLDEFRNVRISVGAYEAGMDSFLKDIDPITFEVISHRLHQIANETATTLERVGGTVNTTQQRDYMAALYRANGDILAGGSTMGQHVACAGFAVKKIIERFDGEIFPDDLFLLNDPYLAAIHQSDVYMISPIHVGDRLVAWSATFVHVTDIGAMSPGGDSPGATEIFHEGIRIPGLKLVEKGTLRRDVFETIIHMTRHPVMVGLDLKCEIAANNVARSRMQEMYGRYGAELLDAVASEMIRYSEIVLRGRIREAPDGSWTERSVVEADEPLNVTLTLHKQGDHLLFDFEGTDRQAKRGVNLARHATFGWCFAALLPVLAYDIPKNHGLLRPLDIAAPEGTLVNVRYPGPVSLNTTSSGHTVRYLARSALMQMLARSEKWKKEVMAVNAGHRNAKHAGLNQAGKYCVFNMAHGALDGTGARSFADGIDSGGGNFMSCPNVEWFELNFPILYLFRRHVVDGGGAGKFRGGAGAETAHILHKAPEGKITGVAYGVTGSGNSGQGIFGGWAGAPSVLTLWEDTNVERLIAANKAPVNMAEINGRARELGCCDFELTKNDVLYMRVAMGGGYGDPLERAPDAVLKDIRDGLVSREAAYAIYGVALTDGGQQVDLEATEERRGVLRRRRDGIGESL